MNTPTITLPNTHTAYFLSDLHLSEETPNILSAFEQSLKQLIANNHIIFLLGDLFELWVGDDNIDPIAERIATATSQAQQAGCQIYLMHGNRDFLIATQFAEHANLHLLADPSFLKLPEHTVLLTHGDQFCTDDIDYQKFRLMSRSDTWKNQFINMPLEQRLALANQMRQHSKTHKSKYTNQDIMDVNPQAVENAANGHWPSGNNIQPSTTIIHGHTHRCALHPKQSSTHQEHLSTTKRIVLPDWNENISSSATDYPQNGFLELKANGHFKLRTNITER